MLQSCVQSSHVHLKVSLGLRFATFAAGPSFACRPPTEANITHLYNASNMVPWHPILSRAASAVVTICRSRHVSECLMDRPLCEQHEHS